MKRIGFYMNMHRNTFNSDHEAKYDEFWWNIPNQNTDTFSESQANFMAIGRVSTERMVN